MKKITLEVSELTAEKLEKMTRKEKRAIEETLSRIISNRKSLSEIIHEASEQARKNGLTPELMEELLKEE
ncbi:MAG: hypothetical protein JNL53_20485 [Cyclobacteriaceae bacterium]|nr:hypothetical protein [Cyclobacteriaceae bacterium]